MPRRARWTRRAGWTTCGKKGEKEGGSAARKGYVGLPRAAQRTRVTRPCLARAASPARAPPCRGSGLVSRLTAAGRRVGAGGPSGWPAQMKNGPTLVPLCVYLVWQPNRESWVGAHAACWLTHGFSGGRTGEFLKNAGGCRCLRRRECEKKAFFGVHSLEIGVFSTRPTRLPATRLCGSVSRDTPRARPPCHHAANHRGRRPAPTFNCCRRHG